MIKKILILIVLNCNLLNIYSQNKMIDSLVSWLGKHPEIDSQYVVTLHRISYRTSESDVKKSFSYYEKVASLSDSLNFNYGKSLAQINLGILLSNSASYEASNTAYFKAIDYAELSNALRLKSICLNNIGENFKVLRNYDKCRKYTKEAILINGKLSAWRGVAINYELLQECDLEEKLYTNARENLLTGLPFAVKANEPYILSQFNVGFGKLQAIYKHPDSAQYYFTLALQQARSQNDLRNEYQAYVAQAKYLTGMAPEKKIIILGNALSIARQTDYFEGQAKAALELSDIYDQLNNKDSSLFYYRIHRSTFDTLFSENNKRNTVLQESEWMVRRKEIENEHLKELAAIQKKRLELRMPSCLHLLSVLASLPASLFLLINPSRLKRNDRNLSLNSRLRKRRCRRCNRR